MISIIGFLATASMVLLNSARVKARDAKRAADLKQIQTALEMYYDSNNSYPNPGLGWRSECEGWGNFAANNVIPGLAPTYIGSFPSDPSMNKSANKSCYLYLSNGTDYAVLDHDGPEINYSSRPFFVDPARDGGGDGCVVDGTNIWSWKISSPGGRCW